MKDWKRWLPGAIISVGFIAVFLYFVDFGEMVKAIRNANYVFLGIAFAPPSPGRDVQRRRGSTWTRWRAG